MNRNYPMEYKNLEEMLENFEFEEVGTGGGCFYYERRVPESEPFSIVLFTDHRDKWIKQEATENYTHEEMMEDHQVEYTLYVIKSEYLEDEPEDLGSKMYFAEGFPPEYGNGWHSDWKKLEAHIQATIELSESLILSPEYIEKYGCTHKQLLDKYRNLDVDEFKELLRIKQNFPESYCMECGAFTDGVEIENPDCPECGE
jgi:hypothetical protein